MSLTRINRNFFPKVGRRVPPALSPRQRPSTENPPPPASDQPSTPIPSSVCIHPALSLREEGFGALQINRLLRSQVVGRNIPGASLSLSGKAPDHRRSPIELLRELLHLLYLARIHDVRNALSAKIAHFAPCFMQPVP